MLICLDAGHGQYTSGKRCKKSIDPNETREWVLNSRIATKVQDLLKSYECETMRVDDTTGKTDVSLANRVKAANNAKADVYVSIHHNAGINGGSGGGIVVYTAPGCSKTSLELQDAVYDCTVAQTGLKGNRSDPKPQKGFYVIKYTNMPAVLGEFGYMDSTTDTPIILTEDYADKIAQGIVEALDRVFGLEAKPNASTSAQPSVRELFNDGEAWVIPCEVKDFAVVMVDKAKNSCPNNTANAGFFANYTEKGEPFTLPVAHVVCDFEANSEWCRHYCEERGKFNGDKFFFDSSKWSYQNPVCGKAVSTLFVKDGEAWIDESVELPDCDYAISGVPVIRNGKDASWNDLVKPQGWTSGSLYATCHVLVGLKKNDPKIYIIGWKSTKGNLISSSEAYNKFAPMGFVDLLKLDGGGSYRINVAYGNSFETVKTSENRRINTILKFVPYVEETKAPIVEPEPEPEPQPEESNDPEYDQWVKYMDMYRQQLANQPATLTTHVQQAIDMGLTDGSRPCDFATREEVMTMVKNAKS